LIPFGSEAQKFDSGIPGASVSASGTAFPRQAKPGESYIVELVRAMVDVALRKTASAGILEEKP